jgi:hypothetical protein
MIDPREMAAHRDLVPRVYEAIDQEIGRILAAAPRGSNLLVLSDHGFHASHREDVKALVDMDAVLERLGYLARGKDGIDFARTRVYTYGSPDFERVKMLRFSLAGREPGGRVRPEEREALRRRLEADLPTVTNDRGEPVLFLREARPKRGEDGDFVAIVRLPLVTPVLRVRGRPFPPALRSLGRISGTHTSAPVAAATGATAPTWSKWVCVSRMPSSVTPSSSIAASSRSDSSPGSTISARSEPSRRNR